MKLQWSLVLAVAVVAASPVSTSLAGHGQPLPAVKVATRDQFVALKEQVDGQLQSGGRFEFITHEDRVALTRRFDHMQSLFDKFGSTQAMDPKSKFALTQDQSEVKAILSRHDGERQICDSKTLSGATVRRNVCRHHSDVAREKLNEQKDL
jgi:hypothetical protein